MENEVWTPRSGGRSGSRSSSIGSGSAGSGSNIEYTSLRDMLLEGGSGSGGGESQAAGWGFRVGSWRECNGDNIHEFDASNIGIRNQLLKHAASAYLQSAVVVGGSGGHGGREGQECCLIRLWRRVAASALASTRGRVLMRECSWHACVYDVPAELCARLAAFFAGIWT